MFHFHQEKWWKMEIEPENKQPESSFKWSWYVLMITPTHLWNPVFLIVIAVVSHGSCFCFAPRLFSGWNPRCCLKSPFLSLKKKKYVFSSVSLAKSTIWSTCWLVSTCFKLHFPIFSVVNSPLKKRTPRSRWIGEYKPWRSSSGLWDKLL